MCGMFINMFCGVDSVVSTKSPGSAQGHVG